MLLVALLLLSLPARALAQKVGKLPRTMYVTFDHTPLYDSASYLSEIVADLRRGDSVQVNAATGKFYRIAMEGKEGYLLVTNVSERRPTTRGEAKPDTSSPPGATRAGGSSPAARGRSGKPASPASEIASVQCRAITKSGKQCSRMTSDPSGLCWQHKR
jgi:uncharacterized protein YgiM (DUF1202 family)